MHGACIHPRAVGEPWDVVVVGGGASGSLVAAWLVREAAGAPLRVALLDRTGGFARGVAYGTRAPHHLLNVPAGRMGADPADPGGFLAWARARGIAARPGDFLPRVLYGHYLEALLAQAQRAAGARLERLEDEALEVRPGAGGLEVALASGRHLGARVVVLATGNLPARDVPVPDEGLYRSESYARSPWEAGALERIGPDERVLLVGSGLTAVDVLVSLQVRGHRGAVHALSRHGLLPRVHGVPRPLPAPPGLAVGAGARALLRALRRAVGEAAAQGASWQDVLDALRPRNAELWQGMGTGEQARFLRHLAPYWEVHRHRMAPEVAAVVEAMHERGRLHLHAGRLLGYTRVADGGWRARWRPRGAGGVHSSVHVEQVVNCTGPCPPAASGDPLSRALLRRGLAQPDAHRLGFATADGALLAADVRASGRLFAVGPLRRGELYETTAMPEIRVQARDVARRVLDALGAPRPHAPRDPPAPAR